MERDDEVRKVRHEVSRRHEGIGNGWGMDAECKAAISRIKEQHWGEW